MIPICDERRAADVLAYLDAKQRDRLIAEKADDRGHYDDSKIGYRLGMDEADDRFIAYQERGQGHDKHNHHAGEVFKSAQAVGEPLAGSSSSQEKRHPQRERRGGIAEVMH